MKKVFIASIFFPVLSIFLFCSNPAGSGEKVTVKMTYQSGYVKQDAFGVCEIFENDIQKVILIPGQHLEYQFIENSTLKAVWNEKYNTGLWQVNSETKTATNGLTWNIGN